MNVMIRQAVSPDIEYLSRFDHCVKTDCVWQMSQSINESQIQTIFNETHLPREMRLTYPRSPDTLETRWKNYSSVLVACVDKAPVGYASISALFSPEMIWVNDLVVDELWRRKGHRIIFVSGSQGLGFGQKIFTHHAGNVFQELPGYLPGKKIGF